MRCEWRMNYTSPTQNVQNNSKLYVSEPKGTTALCSSWHLLAGFVMCIDLSLALMTWVATHSPFSAGPVCCKVLAISGENRHSSLLIFRDIKFYLIIPALLRTKSASEIFEPVAPHFANKDCRDGIQYLVCRIARDRPERALQIHGGTQRITEERFVVLSIVCLICNEHTGGSGICCCFYFN